MTAAVDTQPSSLGSTLGGDSNALAVILTRADLPSKADAHTKDVFQTLFGLAASEVPESLSLANYLEQAFNNCNADQDAAWADDVVIEVDGCHEHLSEPLTSFMHSTLNAFQDRLAGKEEKVKASRGLFAAKSAITDDTVVPKEDFEFCAASQEASNCVKELFGEWPAGEQVTYARLTDAFRKTNGTVDSEWCEFILTSIGELGSAMGPAESVLRQSIDSIVRDQMNSQVLPE